MKYRFSITATVLIIVAGLLLVGCGNDSTPVVSGETTELNLEDDLGGYKATDEAPGFNDPEILSVMGEDAAPSLAATGTLDVDSLLDNPDYNMYLVAVRWGQLEGDSTVAAITDWAGTASVIRGAIVPGRVIRFERDTDSLLPFVSQLQVSWASLTTVHFDGIIFVVADPINPDDALTVESSFTFATAPYTATFNMAELENLDTIITVDDLGNQVAICARQIRPFACNEGLLEGVWRPDNRTGRTGKFFGKWVNNDGTLAGHISGHWGIRGNGDQVFFGKWINRAGVFKGFIRGTYQPDEAVPGQGTFRGDILTRNKIKIGTLGGEYLHNPEASRGGFLHGRWSTYCPEDTEEGDG